MSLPEQHHIVTFLDREAAKIDALVEAQRHLIELLKEQPQAVISRAGRIKNTLHHTINSTI